MIHQSRLALFLCNQWHRTRGCPSIADLNQGWVVSWMNSDRISLYKSYTKHMNGKEIVLRNYSLPRLKNTTVYNISFISILKAFKDFNLFWD